MAFTWPRAVVKRQLLGLHHINETVLRNRTAITIFRVRHVTEYRYRRPVRFGKHQILFRPGDSFESDSLADYSSEPQPVRWLHDVFGNCVAHVTFQRASKVLRFDTTTTLDRFPQDGPPFVTDDRALVHPFSCNDEELQDLQSTIQRQVADDSDEVEHWARAIS